MESLALVWTMSAEKQKFVMIACYEKLRQVNLITNEKLSNFQEFFSSRNADDTPATVPCRRLAISILNGEFNESNAYLKHHAHFESHLHNFQSSSAKRQFNDVAQKKQYAV